MKMTYQDRFLGTGQVGAVGGPDWAKIERLVGGAAWGGGGAIHHTIITSRGGEWARHGRICFTHGVAITHGVTPSLEDLAHLCH